MASRGNAATDGHKEAFICLEQTAVTAGFFRFFLMAECIPKGDYE
jgi:hypothetical protein